MEDLILIAHGLVVGSAVYLGFYLLFFMILAVMDDDGNAEAEQSSILDKCMDKLPAPILLIGMFFVPIFIFILSFVPAMLALAFGPAYIFEVTSTFECNGVVLSPRTGVTKISTCTKMPVWVGVIAGFCGCAYFHIFRHPVSDGGPQEW